MAEQRIYPVQSERYERGHIPEGMCRCGDPVGLHVHTVNGAMIVSPGDWVETLSDGTRYVHKPNVSARVYARDEVR